MTVGQIAAGARILADTIAAIAPLCVIKPADESVTSSTVLQDDNALVLPVVADGTYIMVCYLDYEGGTQGSSDLQWEWALPASSTLRYTEIHTGLTGNIAGAATNLGSTIGTAGTDGGNLRAVLMVGSLLVSSTAGNLQLKWAQNTSDSTPTIVHAQSFLAMWEIT